MKNIFILLVLCQCLSSCNKPKNSQKSHSVSSQQSLSAALSGNPEFREYIINIKRLKCLAFSSVKSNGLFYFKNNISNHSTVYSVNSLKNYDDHAVKTKLNGLFYKGDKMFELISANMEIAKKLKNQFPQILDSNLLFKHREIFIAIDTVLSSISITSFEDQERFTSNNQNLCEYQYYTAAVICAFNIETSWGAMVCYMSSCAALDKCIKNNQIPVFIQ